MNRFYMKEISNTHSKSLLTVSQAAQQYAVCERLIRRWVADREIPYHRIGRSIRLAPADLDAFVANHRVEPIE